VGDEHVPLSYLLLRRWQIAVEIATEHVNDQQPPRPTAVLACLPGEQHDSA
jgi:hypothetical protein